MFGLFIPHEVRKKAFPCFMTFDMSKIHSIIVIIDQFIAPNRRAIENVLPFNLCLNKYVITVSTPPPFHFYINIEGEAITISWKIWWINSSLTYRDTAETSSLAKWVNSVVGVWEQLFQCELNRFLMAFKRKNQHVDQKKKTLDQWNNMYS